jgi:hypothetical protein
MRIAINNAEMFCEPKNRRPEIIFRFMGIPYQIFHSKDYRRVLTSIAQMAPISPVQRISAPAITLVIEFASNDCSSRTSAFFVGPASQTLRAWRRCRVKESVAIS